MAWKSVLEFWIPTTPFLATPSINVGGEWRFYNNEQTGTSLTASSQAMFPLRGKDAKSTWLNFAAFTCFGWHL
jgi:hypothetical protein